MQKERKFKIWSTLKNKEKEYKPCYESFNLMSQELHHVLSVNIC